MMIKFDVQAQHLNVFLFSSGLLNLLKIMRIRLFRLSTTALICAVVRYARSSIQYYQRWLARRQRSCDAGSTNFLNSSFVDVLYLFYFFISSFVYLFYFFIFYCFCILFRLYRQCRSVIL